ncbi:hypothetical protein AAZX31_13G248900 [Glycine max]
MTMMWFVMSSSSKRVSMFFIFLFVASQHFGSNARLIPLDEEFSSSTCSVVSVTRSIRKSSCCCSLHF